MLNVSLKYIPGKVQFKQLVELLQTLQNLGQDWQEGWAPVVFKKYPALHIVHLVELAVMASHWRQLILQATHYPPNKAVELKHAVQFDDILSQFLQEELHIRQTVSFR